MRDKINKDMHMGKKSQIWYIPESFRCNLSKTSVASKLEQFTSAKANFGGENYSHQGVPFPVKGQLETS